MTRHVLSNLSARKATVVTRVVAAAMVVMGTGVLVLDAVPGGATVPPTGAARLTMPNSTKFPDGPIGSNQNFTANLDPNTSRTAADGVTNGTATVSSASANFTSADQGRAISGSTDIPDNSYIGAVNSSTSINLQDNLGNPVNATGSHSSVTLTIAGPPAHCKGDSATNHYREYSYLVTHGTDPTTIDFTSGSPDQGVGFFDSAGRVWENRNTAASSGQFLGIPVDLQWGHAVAIHHLDMNFLFPGAATTNTLDGGFGCAPGDASAGSPQGHLNDFWAVQITFTKDSTDPNGFTWQIPGQQLPPTTTTSTTTSTSSTSTTTPGATTTSTVPGTSTTSTTSTTRPPSTTSTSTSTSTSTTSTTQPTATTSTSSTSTSTSSTSTSTSSTSTTSTTVHNAATTTSTTVHGTTTSTTAAPSVTVTNSSPPAGASVSISASGLPPNETFTIELHSTPVQLGTATSDSTGHLTATVTIPATTATGSHSIALVDPSGVTMASIPLTVSSTSVTPSPTPVLNALSSPSIAQTGGSLPRTGFSTEWPTMLGVLLIVGGVGLAALTRKREIFGRAIWPDHG